MKFHIAFTLLVVFGAAQAGKKPDVLSWGTGYKDTNDEGGEDMLDGVSQGSSASTLMHSAQENTEQASDMYETKSESHYSSAEIFKELYNEKRQNAAEYKKKAANEAAEANEAYKKAQLHKREAKDKQAISKEYEQRALKFDRRSKDQEIQEVDAHRKSEAETSEYSNHLATANRHIVMAGTHQELHNMELELTNECEQQAKELHSRSEEFEKLATKYKEKAKKAKEESRVLEAKSKEESAKAEEMEKAFMESSKKALNTKFFQHDFAAKAEHENYLASYAHIRSFFMGRMDTIYAEKYKAAMKFANMEKKDSESFHRNADELYREAKVLTATAAHLMKQHRYTGHQAYSKKPFPNSNYHGA